MAENDISPDLDPVELDREPRSRLKVLKDFLSVLQAFFIICSILAAAVWFVMHREAWPKANISHEVNHLQISPEWTWVRVAVRLENVSKRLLEIDTGTIRVQQILPLDPRIAQSLAAGENPVSTEELIVPWPRLGDSYQLKTHCEIEPGETDILEYEFIIPSNIQVVKIYTYFANGDSVPLGWSKGSIYDLRARQSEDRPHQAEVHSQGEKVPLRRWELAQLQEQPPQPQQPQMRPQQPKRERVIEPEANRQVREEIDSKWGGPMPRQSPRPDPLPSTERTLQHKN